MIPCHAVAAPAAARRSTLLAEALHRVAASKYTYTRVLEHEPGTAAGAGRRPRIGTPRRRGTDVREDNRSRVVARKLQRVSRSSAVPGRFQDGLGQSLRGAIAPRR
jgi:hypothetical protein